MIIDVVDLGDEKVGATFTELKKLGSSEVIPIYGASYVNGNDFVVKQVCAVAKRPGTINALRIWNHGKPGGQVLTGGTLAAQGILLANFDEIKPVLEILTSFFAPKAYVELRGCGVGRGINGCDLLIKLAALWNVTVYAAVEDQPMVGLEWYGPVQTVRPGGNPHLTSGQRVK